MATQGVKRDGFANDTYGFAPYTSNLTNGVGRYGVLDAIDLDALAPAQGTTTVACYFLFSDAAADALVLKAFELGVTSMLHDRLRLGKRGTAWDGVNTRYTIGGIRPDLIEPTWANWDGITAPGNPVLPAVAMMIYDNFADPDKLVQSAFHTRIALHRLLLAGAP